MKSTIVRISGRVQGVWFRAWTEKQAIALGLDGWVRNRQDVTVEALFSGDDANVDRMVADCHDGPSAHGWKTCWSSPVRKNRARASMCAPTTNTKER